MLFLSLNNLLNRYCQCLLLHLFEPKGGLFIILLELLTLHCRALPNDAPHDLIVLSVNAFCFSSFEYVIERSRGLQSLCKVFLLDLTSFTLGDIHQPFQEHLIAPFDLASFNRLLILMRAYAIVIELVLHHLIL